MQPHENPESVGLALHVRWSAEAARAHVCKTSCM